MLIIVQYFKYFCNKQDDLPIISLPHVLSTWYDIFLFCFSVKNEFNGCLGISTTVHSMTK